MFLNRIEVAFDSGHRLLDYPGKCASPHGHTFRAEVLVRVSTVDELGIGIDFGELKSVCKAWIDGNWDHGFLLNDADVELLGALRLVPEAKLYTFASKNPTAEVMAETLFDALRGAGWDLQSVRIWESRNQYAEFIPAPVAANNGAYIKDGRLT